LAADEGFVQFEDAAVTAERAATEIDHRLANAVRHEPRRLVRHVERAMELVAADPLLAGAHERGREQPFVERDLAALEDGSDCHAVLLAAGSALPESRPVRLALELIAALSLAAVRADRPFGPADALQIFAGRVGIVEVAVGQVHDVLSLTAQRI